MLTHICNYFPPPSIVGAPEHGSLDDEGVEEPSPEEKRISPQISTDYCRLKFAIRTSTKRGSLAKNRSEKAHSCKRIACAHRMLRASPPEHAVNQWDDSDSIHSSDKGHAAKSRTSGSFTSPEDRDEKQLLLIAGCIGQQRSRWKRWATQCATQADAATCLASS